ncbi:MAG: hypothetical protein ABIH38_03785 [Patescibacteria group bacterium]
MDMEIGHVHHVYGKAGALVIANTACCHVRLGDSVRIAGQKDSFLVSSLQVNDHDRTEVFPEDDLFGLRAAGLGLKDSYRRKKVFLVPKENAGETHVGSQSEHDIWQGGAVQLSSDGLTVHPEV